MGELEAVTKNGVLRRTVQHKAADMLWLKIKQIMEWVFCFYVRDLDH